VAVHDHGVDAIETLPQVTPTDQYVDRRFPESTVTADRATGEILVVDDFGNAVTNLPGGVLDGRFGDTVTVGGDPVRVRRAYAAVDPGRRLVTVGSHGNVELAVNRGRGDDAFGLTAGDTVTVEL